MPGGARNAAIREAREPWVALVDAGCEPDPRWLEELLAPVARDPELDVVFGDHLPVLRREWDRVQALTIMSPRDPGTGVHGPSVASMLLRRSLWAQLGGFRDDLRAAEDHLFFAALAAATARTAWAPAAVVHWQLSSGPAAAFKRLVAYSEHHLRAGLFATWHRRVMLMDLFAVAAIALLPLVPALGLVSLLFGARAFLTAWRRRGNVAGARPLRPSRLAGVAFLLILADVAVWLGALKMLRRRRT
jgi:glycosyltransferase involved in cell wall biosynthesis